jgi:regulator of RNase E activity RraA
MNVPIACGGVAVYPGDIVVGDVDGVVIVPRYMASEVAQDATEQEVMEEFLSSRVEGGAMLRGTYPPNEETLAAYKEWRKQR